VQNVEADGFSGRAQFVGHGMGPGCTKIPGSHYGQTGNGTQSARGELCVHRAMVNVGKPGFRLSDGWETASTRRWKFEAHFRSAQPWR